MNRKRILTTVLFTFGGAIIFSCGGGGGSSDSNPPPSSPPPEEQTTQTTTITGTVESSVVKGAKVCINGTDICVITDGNGTFKLETKETLPLVLKVETAGVPLGQITANSTFVPVNPVTLAEGNLTLAPVVKALVHAIGGDINGTAEVIDLTNVEVVNASVSKPIVELLKEKKEVAIKVKVNDKEVVVNATPSVVVANNQTVNTTVDDLNLKLWSLKMFFAQSDGKSVKIVDIDGNTVATCRLDAEAPNLVKLEDCSDPNWNTDWGRVVIDKNKNKVAIENTLKGEYYYLTSLDPVNGVVCLDVNGQQFCGYVSDKEEAEDNEKIEYAKLLSFLGSRDGKIVNIEDSEGETATCTFVVNPAANNQFALVNCNPNDFNSDEWTKVEDEKTREGWKLEGEIYGYITSFDTNNNQLSVKIYDDETKQWITATLTFTDQNGIVIYPGPINDLTKFGIYGKVKYSGVIPPEWKIRITPANEQVEGSWGGVICQIFTDGSFGQRCEVHGDIEDFTKDTTYQVIVFEDQNYDWHWEANEPSVFGMENATFGSWQNLDLTGVEVPNNTENEVTAETITPKDFLIQNYSPDAVENALQSLNGKRIVIFPVEVNGGKVECDLTYQNNQVQLSNCDNSEFEVSLEKEIDKNNYVHLTYNNANDWDDFMIFYASDGIVCGYSLHYGDVNCLVDTSKIPASISDTDLQGDWKVSENDLKQWIPGTFTFEGGSLYYNGTKLADYSISENTIGFSNQASNFDAKNAIVIYELSPTEWLVQKITTDNDATLHIMQKQ